MKLIVLSFIILCLNSCNNDTVTDNADSTNYITNIKKDTTINLVLKDKISVFIQRHDSIASANSNFSEKDIYIVEFSKEKKDCYVYIFDSYFYQKDNFIGFITIEERMVAFYNIDEVCMYKLVNKPLLQKEVPKKFPCFEDIEAFPYEPKYVKYKIISKDSLEFIEYGRI